MTPFLFRVKYLYGERKGFVLRVTCTHGRILQNSPKARPGPFLAHALSLSFTYHVRTPTTITARAGGPQSAHKAVYVVLIVVLCVKGEKEGKSRDAPLLAPPRPYHGSLPVFY